MSGAWGLGPLDEAAAELAADGVWVLAVAGANAAMERKLRELAAGCTSVIPFGYTERVPELMAASDVVVTSSGDTCREARTLGRGIVLLDVVPGHGRENLMHETGAGRRHGVHADAGFDRPGRPAPSWATRTGPGCRRRPGGPPGAGPVRGGRAGVGFEL